MSLRCVVRSSGIDPLSRIAGAQPNFADIELGENPLLVHALHSLYMHGYFSLLQHHTASLPLRLRSCKLADQMTKASKDNGIPII
jgi:hypothetical protein